MSVPSYRITAEDLHDADKKTQRAISPLLDALNTTLDLLVSVVNAFAPPTPKTANFTTAANGAAYLKLGALGVTPQDLWVSNLTPADGSTLDTVWSMSWIPQTAGATILFVGLEPLQTYTCRVRYQ